MKIWTLIVVCLFTLGTYGDANADRINDGITAVQNKNYQEAINILEPMAKLGDSDAQTWLGTVYLQSDGPNYDVKEARRLFGLAAEQGNARAQGQLGELYLNSYKDKNGFSIEHDPQTAVLWFQKGAEGGDVWSQWNLSLHYSRSGVQQDRAKAVKYARLAAEQGFIPAYYRLGSLLNSILNNPSSEDQKEAIYWYEMAARESPIRSRQAGAMIQLGGMYTNGKGVPEDKIKGYMWFVLAVAYDDNEVREGSSTWPNSRHRDYAGKELTSEERREAEEMAREWMRNS